MAVKGKSAALSVSMAEGAAPVFSERASSPGQLDEQGQGVAVLARDFEHGGVGARGDRERRKGSPARCSTPRTGVGPSRASSTARWKSGAAASCGPSSSISIRPQCPQPLSAARPSVSKRRAMSAPGAAQEKSRFPSPGCSPPDTRSRWTVASPGRTVSTRTRSEAAHAPGVAGEQPVDERGFANALFAGEEEVPGRHMSPRKNSMRGERARTSHSRRP